MKIAVFVRTFRDLEEIHIARFIESHSFADTIYIGTCQTSAKTIEIASRYPNVQFKEFDKLYTLSDGEQGAHESLYYFFLLEWAEEEIAKGNVDVMVMDDADHFCSPSLQRDARRLIEESNAPFFYCVLLYVWGTEYYFPALNKCCPSERLWGWNVHQWMPDINPVPPFTIEITNQPDRDIANGFTFSHPPYALLHHTWTTEEIVWKKMAFNIKRGVAQRYPLDNPDCGELEPIPQWALE